SSAAVVSSTGCLLCVFPFPTRRSSDLRVASPPVWQMAGFFLLLGVALIWWRCGSGRLAGALAGGLLLLWVWSPRDLPAAGTFRVTFLDVGQGEAALVETADGRGVLIDG